MSEGQDISLDENPQISRRDLFKKAGGLGAGAFLLARGIHPDNNAVEYAKDTGPLRVILGNHLIPPEIDTKVRIPFRETGNLNLCAWNQEAVSIVDQAMKKAKEQNKPYFLMLDSASTTQEESFTIGGQDPGIQKRLSERPVNWTWLPHPDLMHKEQYPKKIYIISGDQRDDFGLSEFPQETYLARQDLIEDLNQRYRQKSKKEITTEIIQDTKGALPEKVSEGAIGAALLAAGLPESATTRRKVLKIIGLLTTAGAIETGKGLLEGNALSTVAGKLSDPEEQRIITALSNSVDWTIGDKNFMLWVNARTAIAVEKATELSKSPPAELSNQPTNIDLLYGSAHSSHLPRIMDDQQYRHELIKAYLKDMLQQMNEYIKEDQTLSPHRDALLTAAANSITSYKIDEIHMPWGQTTIPKDSFGQPYTYQFSETLTSTRARGVNHSLQTVATKVLEEFGIKS